MNNTGSNELQKVFDYEGHKVRTVMINGEPYFVAKDICDVLEITNSRMAMTRLKDNEKLTITDPELIVSLTDDQMTRRLTLVNETGMYLLIMRSRKPEAEDFSRWIASEVLPSIRKTGSYSTSDNDNNDAGNRSIAEYLHLITGELVNQEKRFIEFARHTDARFEKTEDTFIKTLSEPSDRATFTRKVRELAKLRFAGRIHEAYSVVYQVVREKYGVDVTARAFNERKRLQQERREQRLKPYAQSTLETKVTQVDVLERLGMLDEAMEIVVGSIAKYWKEKGRDSAEEVC